MSFNKVMPSPARTMAMAARLSLVAKRILGRICSCWSIPGVICLLSRQKLDEGLLPQPLHGEAVRLHQRVGRGENGHQLVVLQRAPTRAVPAAG